MKEGNGEAQGTETSPTMREKTAPDLTATELFSSNFMS